MINGTGLGKLSVFYIGWHSFALMPNTLLLQRTTCSLIEPNCKMLYHLIQAKKYFVKSTHFKMSQLLNAKDDGWFRWTNIRQIIIRHSAPVLVSLFQEMLLKGYLKLLK